MATVSPACAGFNVSVAVLVTPPKEAETVTAVEVVTELVVTVKVVLVAPAGTLTLAGTLAAAELSESATTTPPEGAAPLSVTVPCEELPPVTLAGLSASVESVTGAGGGGGAAGCTLSDAVLLAPL